MPAGSECTHSPVNGRTARTQEVTAVFQTASHGLHLSIFRTFRTGLFSDSVVPLV